MKRSNLRAGFSMLTSIFLIVIMATVGIFVMSLSGKIIKTTTAQFQDAQAQLYAKSYTEFAILAVTGHSRATNCINIITGTVGDINNGGYAISTNIAYIGIDAEVGNCTQVLSNTVSTSSTPLTIIIDVYVKYKDLDNANQTLTAHRRTVQKI
ncbi:MAG: type II secretion system protein [Sulfurovum sp.]|nr:type II secretion system protein [Sulfurovum sp.]